MSKPDDIPQDIWDVVDSLPIHGDGFCDEDDLAIIARAILSERTKAAEIAENISIDPPAGLERDPDRFYDAGILDASQAISQAIRKGGKE